MKIKSTNPKLKQDQIAKELCFSVSTLKRKKLNSTRLHRF